MRTLHATSQGSSAPTTGHHLMDTQQRITRADGNHRRPVRITRAGRNHPRSVEITRARDHPHTCRSPAVGRDHSSQYLPRIALVVRRTGQQYL